MFTPTTPPQAAETGRTIYHYTGQEKALHQALVHQHGRALRDDLRLLPEAAELGWQIELDNRDAGYDRTTLARTWMHPASFTKYPLVLWEIRAGWRAALLLENRYCAHYTVGQLALGLSFEYPSKAVEHYRQLCRIDDAYQVLIDAHDWPGDHAGGMVYHRQQLLVRRQLNDYREYLGLVDNAGNVQMPQEWLAVLAGVNGLAVEA